MVTSDVKYFENGFLTLGTSNTTNPIVLGLQDISLSYTVDTEELLVFDNNFNKLVAPTFKSWEGSCSGMFIAVGGTSGETTMISSGDTRVTSSVSGAAILELVKARGTTNKVTFKLDTNNYQTGGVILTSYEVSSSAGQPLTFSLSFVGTGELVKTTS